MLLGRSSVMSTTFAEAASLVVSFPRRSEMSALAAAGSAGAPGAVRRSARRPGPSTRRTPGSVRLTRRGRVVVTLMLLGLILAALVALPARSAAGDKPGTPVPTRMVVVADGETLWDIASPIAEPGKVREMIREIEELNALPGPELAAGQKLAVPVPASAPRGR